LESAPDIEVVGEATSGLEAVAHATNLAPDVLLMDLKMPDLGGIEATRRILQEQPGMRVLVVTMFEDDASVFAAMRAGARGYVLKDAQPDDLLRAIRAVGRGEAIFSPTIATRVLDFFANASRGLPRDAFPMLTDREREVLVLLAQNRSNAEIATLAGLTPKTVSNYVSSILGKLQVADRAQAILRAREAGLG
jgi:DNA-binding NarL/FixJ family response regulator